MCSRRAACPLDERQERRHPLCNRSKHGTAFDRIGRVLQVRIHKDHACVGSEAGDSGMGGDLPAARHTNAELQWGQRRPGVQAALQSERCSRDMAKQKANSQGTTSCTPLAWQSTPPSTLRNSMHGGVAGTHVGHVAPAQTMLLTAPGERSTA
jgi:hypothetical protein